MEKTKHIRTYYSRNYFSGDLPFSLVRQTHLREEFDGSWIGKREFWKICFVISGTAENIINEKPFLITPRCVYVIHPDDETAYRITTPKLELYNLLFQPEFIADELAHLTGDADFFSILTPAYDRNAPERDKMYIFEADREIGRLFRAMEREYQTRQENFRLQLKLLLVQLLLLLARKGVRAVKRGNAHNLVGMTDFFLEKNFHRNLSLSDIAAALGLTPSHLARSYAAATGRTVMTTLREKQIRAAAAELTRNPSRPVPEIAAAVGFHDLSSFYRNFRKIFHTTPHSGKPGGGGAWK